MQSRSKKANYTSPNRRHSRMTSHRNPPKKRLLPKHPLPQHNAPGLLLKPTIINKIEPEISQVRQLRKRQQQPSQIASAIKKPRGEVVSAPKVHHAEGEEVEGEVFADKAAHDGPGEEGDVLCSMGGAGRAAEERGENEGKEADMEECGGWYIDDGTEHGVGVLVDEGEEVTRVEHVGGHVVEFAADEEIGERGSEAGAGG